jgi:hypothetical protein
MGLKPYGLDPLGRIVAIADKWLCWSEHGLRPKTGLIGHVPETDRDVAISDRKRLGRAGLREPPFVSEPTADENVGSDKLI